VAEASARERTSQAARAQRDPLTQFEPLCSDCADGRGRSALAPVASRGPARRGGPRPRSTRRGSVATMLGDALAHRRRHPQALERGRDHQGFADEVVRDRVVVEVEALPEGARNLYSVCDAGCRASCPSAASAPRCSRADAPAVAAAEVAPRQVHRRRCAARGQPGPGADARRW
jgi:hypothetical protein